MAYVFKCDRCKKLADEKAGEIEITPADTWYQNRYDKVLHRNLELCAPCINELFELLKEPQKPKEAT